MPELLRVHHVVGRVQEAPARLVVGCLLIGGIAIGKDSLVTKVYFDQSLSYSQNCKGAKSFLINKRWTRILYEKWRNRAIVPNFGYRVSVGLLCPQSMCEFAARIALLVFCLRLTQRLDYETV